MGFEVKDDGRVVVNHSHNTFCVTRAAGNPTIVTTHCGLSVCSIFKRLSHKEKPKSKSKGDNCPMIYALKGQQGLYTTLSDIRLLYSSAFAILTNHIASHHTEYDFIVPMPSAHQISYILARRVQRQVPTATLIQGCLQKSTVGDAKKELANTATIPHSARAAISKQLMRAEREGGLGQLLSLKKIPTQHRCHLSPVQLTTSLPPASRGLKILLVDDLFSTGTTLTSAKNLLSRYFPEANIEALCLFSPHNGKIK